MNTTLTAVTVAGSLLAAVMVGWRLRRVLPRDHQGAETRDTIKLAAGLIATMTALLMGLLVSSAKSSYDATRGQVVQMAARVAYLDRLLAEYGPEAVEVRSRLRDMNERAVRRIWPEGKDSRSDLAPERNSGNEVFSAVLRLSPQNDVQRTLKDQAVAVLAELGQSRELLLFQSIPSVSSLLLIVVVTWLVLIFFSFSLIAPGNATATLSLAVSAISVAGAIFLLLELDQPFSGLMKISPEPLLRTLQQIAN